MERPHFLNTVRVREDGGLRHVTRVHIPDAIQFVERAAESHTVDRHGITRAEAALTLRGSLCRVEHAGHERGKALVIPSVQWQRFYLPLRYGVRDFARGNLHLIHRRFDGHLLGDLPDGKSAIYGAHHGRPQKNIFLNEAGKASFADGDIVGSASQSRHRIGAVGTGAGLDCLACCLVGDCYLRVLNRSSRGIGHTPIQRRCGALCKCHPNGPKDGD